MEHVSPWESFPEGTAGNSYKKHYKLKRNLLAVSSEENERLNQRAIALLMNGDFLESEIIFKTIVKYGPKDSAVINNMAILQELRNRDDRAFIYYNEALNIAPHNNYIRENFIRFKYKPENLKIYGEPLPE